MLLRETARIVSVLPLNDRKDCFTSLLRIVFVVIIQEIAHVVVLIAQELVSTSTRLLMRFNPTVS
jgi:hypothetical protein